MGISDDVLSDLRSRIAKTLDDLRSALAKVRTGRANPQLLDSVRVEYYGTLTPLNQVANVIFWLVNIGHLSTGSLCIAGSFFSTATRSSSQTNLYLRKDYAFP